MDCVSACRDTVGAVQCHRIGCETEPQSNFCRIRSELRCTYDQRMRLLRSPTLLDAVGACALAVAAFAGALAEDVDTSDATRSLDALGILLICGMTLPLASRRVRPRGVVIVALACAVSGVAAGYPVGVGPLGAVFALWSLAYTTTRRDTVLVGLPAIVVLVAGFVAAPGSITASEVASNFLVIAFTLLIGDLLRARRDQNSLLAERNRELEKLRETERRSAIVEERMRIAREVHDVVGHSLVAITLQARAGLRRLSRSPERVGEALREIEGLAVRALEETRTAVATIRGDGDGGPLQRQPTLADLPGLVRAMCASDLDFDLTLDRVAHDLPTGLQSTAYRIVQESLSNVAKHARPAHAAVRLAYEGQAFVIEITDDGESFSFVDEGSGLRGMRERAEQHGGSLEAGPARCRGWRVRATFPVEHVST
jgi:signal transduction histidine kinase